MNGTDGNDGYQSNESKIANLNVHINEKNSTNGYKKFESSNTNTTRNSQETTPLVNGDNQTVTNTQLIGICNTSTINGTINSCNNLNQKNILNTSTNGVDGLDDIETMLANLSTQLDAMLNQGNN